jgi:hypothetical protein
MASHQPRNVIAFPTIREVRTFITQGPGSGGDYHNVQGNFKPNETYIFTLLRYMLTRFPLGMAGGHWLIDSKIATPMSGYEQYRSSRTSWGINVLGSFCVEIEATDGTKGFATGFGGPPACWLVAEHFRRFLIGAGGFPSDRVKATLMDCTQILGTRTYFSSRCTEVRCSTDVKASRSL